MDEALFGLAACIKRASRLARGDESPKSDVYWHTREKCFELANEMKIRWPLVLHEVVNSMYSISDRELDRLSEIFWSQVAHPDIIITDVIGS